MWPLFSILHVACAAKKKLIHTNASAKARAVWYWVGYVRGVGVFVGVFVSVIVGVLVSSTASVGLGVRVGLRVGDGPGVRVGKGVCSGLGGCVGPCVGDGPGVCVGHGVVVSPPRPGLTAQGCSSLEVFCPSTRMTPPRIMRMMTATVIALVMVCWGMMRRFKLVRSWLDTAGQSESDARAHQRPQPKPGACIKCVPAAYEMCILSVAHCAV